MGGLGATLLLRKREPRATPASACSSVTEPAPVDPTDVPALLRTGQAATKRGAIEEAIQCFDQALRVEPALAVAHFCKGVCLAAHGRVGDAYGAFQQAVAAEPEDLTYRIHLARAALAMGKSKDAMDALARVLQEMPEAGPSMLADPTLGGLRDHPRFLVMCGAL